MSGGGSEEDWWDTFEKALEAKPPNKVNERDLTPAVESGSVEPVNSKRDPFFYENVALTIFILLLVPLMVLAGLLAIAQPVENVAFDAGVENAGQRTDGSVDK